MDKSIHSGILSIIISASLIIALGSGALASPGPWGKIRCRAKSMSGHYNTVSHET